MKYLFILLGILVSLCSHAEDYSIPGLQASNLYFWTPPAEQNLSPHEVLEEASWTKVDGELSFGYAYPEIWVTQHLHAYEAEDWTFHISYPLLDYVDIYILKGNQIIQSVKTGDRRPSENKLVNVADYVIGFQSEKASNYRLLVRIETQGSITMPIAWRTKIQYAEHLSLNQTIYGAYYGVLIIMALYHLFIFMVVRERGYLFYSISVSAFVFLQLTFDGRGFQWFWPESPEFNAYSFPIAYSIYQVAIFTFMVNFLNLSESSPRFHKYFILLRAVVVINLLLMFATSYATMMPIIVAVAMFGIVSGLVSGGYLWLQGFVAARFFVLAWTMFLIGILLLNLRGFGVTETNWISQYGYLIGSVLEILFLSFSLADRINTTNREKHKTEKELIQTQNENLSILSRFQELYENAPIGNFQADNRYQLTSVNQACAKLFGFDSADHMVSEVTDIRAYLKSDFDDFQDMVRSTRREGRVYNHEIKIEDKLGQGHWLSISMRFTHDGNEPGYEGSVQDITERKESEELHRKLDQERMQILEKFSLGIATEINTPLGSNVATTAFMRESLEEINQKADGATLEDYRRQMEMGLQSLGLVESNQKRISRVVKRFREVSSQHLDLKESHFTMFDTINESVESHRWKMAGWRVNIVCSPDIKLYSYSKAISVIIKQLIDNALEHSQADQGQDPKIWIRVEDDQEKNVTLTFTDNGKGIRKEMVKNLCQPFFTTKRGPEGHIGLGLYMIYNLVNRSLNGRIFFPVIGQGFCVQITIPMDISEVA